VIVLQEPSDNISDISDVRQGETFLLIDLWRVGKRLNSVHQEIASFGQILRSRNFSILDVDSLRLRSKNHCGLVFGQNLPFPDGH
jgi:hypothetical protein